MKRLTTGVAAVLLALVAAGCGNSDGNGGGSTAGSSTGTESTSGGGDAVAWSDKVCSSIKDDVAQLATMGSPDIDQSSPQATKDSLSELLGKLETALDGMVTGVQDAGTPPVDGGAEAVKSFTDQIGAAKEAVTSAKSKLDAAPVDDPAAFQSAVASVGEDLSKLGDMKDPTASFSANKELDEAYKKAKSCQELESSMSSSPTS